MAASARTAIPAVSEERRGEDAETGGRVAIRRRSGALRHTVAVDDLVETRMGDRQPRRVGSFEMITTNVRHHRNLLGPIVDTGV